MQSEIVPAAGRSRRAPRHRPCPQPLSNATSAPPLQRRGGGGGVLWSYDLFGAAGLKISSPPPLPPLPAPTPPIRQSMPQLPLTPRWARGGHTAAVALSSVLAPAQSALESSLDGAHVPHLSCTSPSRISILRPYTQRGNSGAPDPDLQARGLSRRHGQPEDSREDVGRLLVVCHCVKCAAPPPPPPSTTTFSPRMQ